MKLGHKARSRARTLVLVGGCPAGRCLRTHVTVKNTDIPERNTLFVHGSITGYLTDAPA